MMEKVRRIAIVTVVGALLIIAIIRLSVAYSDIGITDEFWNGGLPATVSNFGDVPQSVVNDASLLATELFGGSGSKYQDFMTQLIGSYQVARVNDVVVLFNPGGWGLKDPGKTDGWGTILTGIQGELSGLGYKSAILDYKRTADTIAGRFKEFVELLTDYPSKARDLATRVQFLTDHLPDLKVLVTGESNGTVISDGVMEDLPADTRVFSIQTGTPFWHHSDADGRTLVLNNNGVTPDSFSEGDIPAIVWASIKASLGISEPGGTVLNRLRAPGHDYSWSYPVVYDSITTFLKDHLGVNQG